MYLTFNEYPSTNVSPEPTPLIYKKITIKGFKD